MSSEVERVPVTAGAALAWGGEILGRSGVELPGREAGELLAFLLGEPPWKTGLDPSRALPDSVCSRFGELLRRRAAREPLAYLLGEWGFHEITLRLDRRVLIPRPETELLVGAALEIDPPPGRCLDLCTGSGAVALALARAMPGAWIGASDLEAGVLEVAALNARRLGLQERVEFRRGDLFAPWAGEAEVDLVTANPPYVAESEWEGLAPEIRLYEPRSALVGGRDGLAVIRSLVSGLPGPLRPGGTVLIEIGAGQGKAVRELFAAQPGFREAEILQDLSGRDRVLRARRR